MAYTQIDLSQLSPPDVVETLDYEAIRAALIEDLRERWPQWNAELESDPVVKLLEVAAYRELLLRARVNDAAKAVLLATASGADLDHLGTLLGVTRLLADPGDPAASPPVDPSYETDARLRARIQLSLEGFSTAGSEGWGLSASAAVRDIAVHSPAPGEVVITVLGAEGDGAPAADLLATVDAALNADAVRPLTDQVTVQGPSTLHTYAVEATLITYPGPSPAPVRAAAEAALSAYTTEHHRLGHDITLSGLYAALHQPGVQRVELTEPAADIVVARNEAAYCSLIEITQGGTDV